MEQHSNIILAGEVGLDLSNMAHAVYMEEVTNGIIDIYAFIEYCRDKKSGITHVTKTEKLGILAKNYKKIQEDAYLAGSYSKSQIYAKEVAGLVFDCRSFVEDHGIDFKQVVINGEKYFEDHQIRCLEAVGSTGAIIEYSKLNELQDLIIGAYIGKKKAQLFPKKYEQLQSKAELKVLGMANKALN